MERSKDKFMEVRQAEEMEKAINLVEAVRKSNPNIEERNTALEILVYDLRSKLIELEQKNMRLYDLLRREKKTSKTYFNEYQKAIHRNADLKTEIDFYRKIESGNCGHDEALSRGFDKESSSIQDIDF